MLATWALVVETLASPVVRARPMTWTGSSLECCSATESLFALVVYDDREDMGWAPQRPFGALAPG